MKRITLLVAVLALSTAAVAAAQDQYPQGTTDPAANQAPTTDQTTTTTTDQSSMDQSSQLPSTASPMPLVGLSGLVALAAGATISRLRRKA